MIKSKVSWKSSVLLIYSVSVFLSFSFSLFKHYSLSFDGPDYTFFLQFAVRQVQPSLGRDLSFYPFGADMFGIGGFDGIGGFFTSFHLEPMKFIYGFIYAIFRTPIFIYLFISLVFFTPLLYWLRVNLNQDQKQSSFFILVALLYVAHPLSYIGLSFDLRPFLFLAPFIFLEFLAIYYKRPLWEIFLFFNLLFFARDESIFYGLFFILFYFCFNVYKNSYKTIKVTAVMAVNWFIWVGLSVVYIRSGQYSLTDGAVRKYDFIFNLVAKHPLSLGSVFLLFLFLLIYIVWWFFKKNKSDEKLSILSFTFFFLAIILPSFLFAWRKAPTPHVWTQLLYFPRFVIIFPSGLCMLVVFFYRYVSDFGKKVTLKFLWVIISLEILFLLMPFLDSPLKLAYKYVQQFREASLVWNARYHTDHYKDVIMANDYTIAAFYDYKNVYIMPCSSPKPFGLVIRDEPQRCFPGNKDYLVDILNHYVTNVIISKSNLTIIKEVESSSKIKLSIREENQKYIWFVVERSN